jgi:hypothetical protein
VEASADLLRAAAHELAHAHVARRLGYLAEWRVVPTRSDALEVEKAWVGTTSFFQPLDPGHRVLIGLAGSLAELALIEPRCTPEEVWEYFEAGAVELSASDAESVGAFSGDDVRCALAMVVELLPEILAQARKVRGSSSRWLVPADLAARGA